MFIFYDTETKEVKHKGVGKKHKLKLGWACYWRRRSDVKDDTLEWFFFRTVKDFWNFVESKSRPKTKIHLIAHNQSFDLPILHAFSELLKRKWKMKAFYEKKPVHIITYKRGSKTLLILDNGNFFKGKLETLGESVGLTKLTVNFENSTYKELKEYCRRDVEIMVRAWRRWLSFHEDFDLGSFAPTISGQAMKTFRHRFMDHDIYIHDRVWATKMERDAYFGGRCECFFIGKVPFTPIYYLDVTSMYPFVMSTISVPIKLVDRIRHVKPKDLKVMIKNHAVIAQVTINTKNNCYPVRAKEKIIFPVGTFETTLATPEVELGLKNRDIKAIEKVILYGPGIIFKSYVDFFYTERQKALLSGDTSQSVFIKYLLNSLYGKFGQKSHSWKTIGECEPNKIESWLEINPDTGKRIYYRCFAGYIQRQEPPTESFDSFPAIAAHITSAARVYLWKLMEQAGKENVFYCDTDSLFVNTDGYIRLKDYIKENTLGALEVKREGTKLVIYGAKHYQLDLAMRRKGIRANAKEIDKSVFQQELWPSLSSMIRKGQIDDYTILSIQKTLSGKYTKGIVTDTGVVKPLNI